MVYVASLGSINVDHIYHVSESDVEKLTENRGWVPDAGETVRVESVPDDLLGGPDEFYVGGTGANQAASASQAGAETSMFGAVGSDHTDDGVLDALSGAGVHVNPVEVCDAPTGAAHVFIEPDGTNRIAVVQGANLCVDEGYVDRHYGELLGADAVLLQNEIPVEATERLLTGFDGEPARPTVILDPSPAADADRLITHESVDIITPNEREYEALSDAIDDYEGIVMQTRGGADVVVEGAVETRITPPSVDALDTTGAGDVFNGYLATKLAEGMAVHEAAAFASVAAALSAQSMGALRSAPSLSSTRRGATDASDEPSR